MTKDTYVAAFKQAQADYARLTDRRTNLQFQLDEVDIDLIKLRRALVGLAALAGSDVEIAEIGLTEACRSVLANAEQPLTTGEVMKEVESLGLDHATHT